MDEHIPGPYQQLTEPYDHPKAATDTAHFGTGTAELYVGRLSSGGDRTYWRQVRVRTSFRQAVRVHQRSARGRATSARAASLVMGPPEGVAPERRESAPPRSAVCRYFAYLDAGEAAGASDQFSIDALYIRPVISADSSFTSGVGFIAGRANLLDFSSRSEANSPTDTRFGKWSRRAAPSSLKA